MLVTFSPQAFQDVVNADIWWRENRDAKDILSDEVRAAVMLLESAPRVGQRVVGRPRNKETRRLVLRRSRFLLFYAVEGERVEVLRVWHPSQRPGGAL